MYVAAGGVMSYAADVAAYRDVGLNYVGRILKGARQPQNREGAGLTIQQRLLVAADDVVE
jgi:hypothetical protein